MKQNITLSLEKSLLKKSKVIAAKRSKSLSKLLSELLEEIVKEEEQYEASRRKAFSLIDKGYHLGGKIITSREELHAR